MKRIILCLDGTWNSAYQKGKRVDGSKVIKPSNVLKLARAIEPEDAGGNQQIVYYDTGVGSLSKFKGFSNLMLRKTDRILGGVWGAGFESNVEDALTFLIHNYVKGDEVYVFGFSRGAATARALTRVIDWMGGIPTKDDVYFLPIFYRYFIRFKGKKSFADLKSKLHKESTADKDLFGDLINLKINFLGVWDTVLSLGGRIMPVTNRSYYVASKLASCVIHGRQALALDERRHDFTPAIWQKYDRESQSLKQRWFAGVHSNIGGGYVNDGLANITWRWMIKEVQSIEAEFAINPTFKGFYRGYIQDELMQSKTLFYKIKDFLMRNKGIREVVTLLDDAYADSELRIHLKTLQRMLSNPARLNPDGTKLNHPQLDLYRPQNLIEYIGQRDVVTFFQSYVDEVNNSGRDARRKAILIEQIEAMVGLFGKFKGPIIPADADHFDTGYDLEYIKTYRISLTELQPFKDAGVKAGLSGWKKQGLSKFKLLLHGLFKRFSRYKSADLFSLIGEVNDEKVDLGRLWAAADFKDFDLRLSDHIDPIADGRLMVYLNDVKGFYWNNKGAFHLTVSPISKPNMPPPKTKAV